MIKTALNAMSRKGYRGLDLAHRMFNRSEKSFNEYTKDPEDAGSTKRRVDGVKKKLTDLRHDYLHPQGRWSGGLHGHEIRGKRTPYLVDPNLARKARKLHSEVRKSKDRETEDSMKKSLSLTSKYSPYAAIDDQHQDHNEYKKEEAKNSAEIKKDYKKSVNFQKKKVKKFDSEHGSHLYRPPLRIDGKNIDSAKIKDHISSNPEKSGIGKIKFQRRKSWGSNAANSSSLKKEYPLIGIKKSINNAIDRARVR